jgi:hypothetical protein
MDALSNPAAVVNAAIMLVGGFNDNQPVTGTPPNFDNSAYGLAAGAVYNEVVQAVGRSFGYDFSRNFAALAESGNAPPPGWLYEYLYPSSGIQVRQILPAGGAPADPNNPLPVNSSVGFTLVGPTQTKVIWTNVAGAQAIISGAPAESVWDSLFQEAVVRALASKLAMANVGKPDLMKVLDQMAIGAEAVSQGRDG